MPRLYYYPIGDSYLLVIWVALVLLALLALGPSGGRLSRRQRAGLLALRAAVIALVILAMLRPTVVYTETKKQPATLVVLVDQSKSMTAPDAIGGTTRWKAVCRAVADATPALAKLARSFDLEAYTFDEHTHALKVERGKIPLDENASLDERPEGRQTAIGAALEDVRRHVAGKRLLGVIVLSDFKETALAPRNLPPQTAAARMKQLGYRLFTFGVGQSGGLGQTQDVAVKDLVVNDSPFVKTDLAVIGHVRVDGFVNREIPVRLLFETAPGKMEEVDRQHVTADSDGQLLPAKLSYAPQRTGECKLTLEAVAQEGEQRKTNNQLSTFVDVRKGGLTVLYVEGGLRVEQKFLRRALDASAEMKVDYVRLDARHPETRPGDFAARFRPGKYDVYILGDVDSIAFRGSELQDLAETVNKGAGLIMLGGFHSFAPGGYFDTPLAKVLPVVMDRLDRQNLDEPIRSDLHLPGPLHMRPTEEVGLLHRALMLAGSRAENEALWKKLPPLEGANRFRDVKPGALVLADDGKGHPLLVSQEYGGGGRGGRVLAFAGDSTWRWWMRGFAAADKRFWRQIVLWLARRDESTESNVWIKLEKRRFAPAERVDFTAGANAAANEPIKDADYEVHIVLPDGTRRSLQPMRKGEHIAGSFPGTQASGDYTIEVEARQKGKPVGSKQARFLVPERDLELDDAAADADLMQELAGKTGGESLAPEELSMLIERLLEQSESFDIQREAKQRLWNKWSFFLALVSLLGVEWYLRKRWGLV